MSIPSAPSFEKIMKEFQFNDWNHIALSRPLSSLAFQQWLDRGLHGGMSYLKDSQRVRQNPQEHFKPMQSIFVVTQNYFPMPDEAGTSPFPSLKIAHYARGKDYHVWFREKLNKAAQALKKEYPNEEFITFTDAVPLLERDYGMQAALGWIGKNTCLIHPKKGSLFFIGEILSTLTQRESPPTPLHDFCGKCRACIDVCPTQALDNNKNLDANKCLSYWNIESKEVPPLEIREKMEGWFFGCDLCQTACPWNIRIYKNHSEFEQKTEKSQSLIDELKYILTTSNKKLMKGLIESPLSRAGGRGLKRNALIIIANLKVSELREDVKNYTSHPQLAELAQWSLSKLD